LNIRNRRFLGAQLALLRGEFQRNSPENVAKYFGHDYCSSHQCDYDDSHLKNKVNRKNHHKKLSVNKYFSGKVAT
jgi:hypothetical protein